MLICMFFTPKFQYQKITSLFWAEQPPPHPHPLSDTTDWAKNVWEKWSFFNGDEKGDSHSFIHKCCSLDENFSIMVCALTKLEEVELT